MNHIPSVQDTSSRLVQIISALVNEMHPGRPIHVQISSHLERDLGLDSLARVELLARLGSEFGVSFTESVLADAETVRDLLLYINQLDSTVASAKDSATLQALMPEGECPIPENAETLIEVLEWHAMHNPQRIHVLLYGENEQAQPMTYIELLQASRRIASGLMAHGLMPGQTVALMLPTGFYYLACYFGVMLAGGVPVPIYPPGRLAQLEEHLEHHGRILNNAQAVFIIAVLQAKSIAARLQREVPSLSGILTPEELDVAAITPRTRCLPGDLAFIQYTSGSTGDPKGVVLTHANLLANIRSMGEMIAVTSEDVFVSWLPLYHDMGLIGAWLGSLYYGMLLVLMSPIAFLSHPLRWPRTISRHRGTLSAAPNFAYELCARKISEVDSKELDLSCWRMAINGAEPVSPRTLETFAKRFSPCGFKHEALSPVYGLAECSVGLSFPPLGRGPRVDSIRRTTFSDESYAAPASAKDQAMLVVSCGRVLPQHEIRIVDDAGEELADRWVGHLQFRGPSATSGYYRNPEATRQLLHDGWLDSGDYAYTVAGEIYIAGRVKDLIIRGGHNIYPYELEHAVGHLPGVRKGCVAVFASNDLVNATERLVVVAETREQDRVRRELLQQKINELAVDIVGVPADEIVLAPPYSVLKTSSGKIRRTALRDAFEQGKISARGEPLWQQWAILNLSLLRTQWTQVMRRTLRTLFASWCWLVFALVVMPSALLVALLQRPSSGRIVLHGATILFLTLIGMPVQVTGLNRIGETAHLLLVNHSSYLDALMLYAALPPSLGYAFVAKRELSMHPLLRSLLSGLGTLFVERFSAAKSSADVETMVSALKAGRNLIVFPEGTFTRESGLKPFYLGAFLAATNAAVPVVIAGLRGTRSVLRDGHWMPRHARIELDVGSRLEALGKDWEAAVHLRDQARMEMLKRCGEHDLMR